jgi:hypothetical protein
MPPDPLQHPRQIVRFKAAWGVIGSISLIEGDLQAPLTVGMR